MTYLTWMIATGEGGYIGRYWPGSPSPWMEGHRCAAWTTRAGARQELVRVRERYPRARVHRVEVTVYAFLRSTGEKP
jgi:hypothetical protein